MNWVMLITGIYLLFIVFMVETQGTLPFIVYKVIGATIAMIWIAKAAVVFGLVT